MHVHYMHNVRIGNMEVKLKGLLASLALFALCSKRIGLIKQASAVPPFMCMHRIRFFTNSQQYKNVSITNFVLVVPLEINETNEPCNTLKEDH